MAATFRRDDYWRRNVRLTALLLAIWFLVTFGVAFFARELNEWTFIGFPFGFYMAAQGALYIYALLIWFYAWYMNRLERDFHDDRPDDSRVNQGRAG